VSVRWLVGAHTSHSEDGSTFAVNHYQRITREQKSYLAPSLVYSTKEVYMSLLVLILVVLLLVGALPTWPYSSGWGYGPSGLLGLILIIVLVFALMGRI
jgi:hypothetical protein